MTKVLTLLFTIFVAINTHADDEAVSLIKGMEYLLWSDSNRGEVSMTVVNENWQRTLEMDVWMDRPNRTFIRIQSPKKEKGVGSLRLNDEMWNYIPKIDRVIKVPPSMMLQPWMGSDFSNDDLVKASSLAEDYEHTIVGTSTDESGELVHIESIAKPEAPVVWGKIELWLYRDSYIPVKQFYFDEQGTAVKELTFEQVEERGGRELPTRWIMRPLDKERQRTIIDLKKMDYDVGIDEDTFSRRNLQDTF